jgi:hypothetical protein
MRKPPANVMELPPEERALMAFRAAVEQLIEDAIREGRSLYMWLDGKVVEVPPKELRAMQESRTK